MCCSLIYNTFFPGITFQTRVNNSSGATPIDDILWKLLSITLQTNARIISNDICDNYPYFIFVNGCQRADKPPRIVKKRLNSDKTIENALTDMNECGISKKMNYDWSSDSNSNYDMIFDNIAKLKD